MDERRQVLDVHAGALMQTLRDATGDARRVKLAAMSQANRVRLVLAQVAEDGELPESMRARIRALLA